MKENINALDEMNKGASMGIDAISFVLDKVLNKNSEHSSVMCGKHKNNVRG